MITIIGIDPGLASTGIGIVEGLDRKVATYAYGSVHTSNTISLATRLEQIFAAICRVLHQEKPKLMVIEDVFSLSQYPKSGITLGQVTGILMLAAQQAGIPVKEIPVREAKRALTGNGNASKKQMERAVRDFLAAETPIRPSHAADALGLALLGLFRYHSNPTQAHLPCKDRPGPTQ